MRRLVATLLVIIPVFGLSFFVHAAQIKQEVPKLLSIAPLKKTVLVIPDVPFYSQFADIQAPEWRKIGCGITSLTMIIDHYQPNAVSVNNLLKQGIASGAYLKNAGWTYKGLISLGNKYGLDGDSYDLAGLSDKTALGKFKDYLKDGPVIASIHYKFDPKSTIPHLVVINGISNDTIYYNDPAAKIGKKTISSADFLKGWKKRFIVMRPVKTVAMVGAKR